MTTYDWVTEAMAALPAEAKCVCPTCQGAESAACTRCAGRGEVRRQAPKRPRQLCTCGGYLKFVDRFAERCPSCGTTLPRWSMR
jgi:DnaJ-class molecular chaperone